MRAYYVINIIIIYQFFVFYLFYIISISSTPINSYLTGEGGGLHVQSHYNSHGSLTDWHHITATITTNADVATQKTSIVRCCCW